MVLTVSEAKLWREQNPDINSSIRSSEMLRKTILACALSCAVVLSGLSYRGTSAIAFAQTGSGSDLYGLNYFANANTTGAPDAAVRIANPGAASNEAAGENGDLCAMIYVFSSDQQMSECCGCPVTTNGLRTLSLNKDLTSSPSASGAKLQNGLIKIVSTLQNGTAPSLCNASAACSPTPNLRAWATHVHGANPAFTATEEAFEGSDLNSGEFASNAGLVARCSEITASGKGAGQCSCGN